MLHIWNTVVLIQNILIRGEAITPLVILKQDGVQLEKDIDYKVTYDKNTDIGTAYIYIDGIGNYHASSKTLTFEITKAKITAADVSTDC